MQGTPEVGGSQGARYLRGRGQPGCKVPQRSGVPQGARYPRGRAHPGCEVPQRSGEAAEAANFTL